MSEIGALELRNGVCGPQLLVDTEWTEDIQRLMVRENIADLVLKRTRVFQRQSLGFLEQVPWVQRFTLLDLVIQDIDGVHALPELRYLHMSDYSRKPIRFSNFPKLVDCRMEFTNGRVSVSCCKKLEYLSLQHFSQRDLSRLTPLSLLSALRIVQGCLEDISAIAAFPLLRELTLGLLRNIKDLTPLAELSGLEELDLEGCKNLGRLDALANLKALRQLNIGNCGQLESLAPLLDCPNLTSVDFSGDTTILDGDISILQNIPNLDYASFLGRRHYNRKPRDVPAYFRHFLAS